MKRILAWLIVWSFMSLLIAAFMLDGNMNRFDWRMVIPGCFLMTAATALVGWVFYWAVNNLDAKP